MANTELDDIIDFELRNMTHNVERLCRKVMELDREKKQVEDVQKRLDEISKEYHQSGKKGKDGIRKMLIDVKTEFYSIQDSSILGARMSKIRGKGQEGCKAAYLKIGHVENLASDCTENEEKSQERKEAEDEWNRFLEMTAMSDTSNYLFEVPISTKIEGRKQKLENTIQNVVKEGDEKMRFLDVGSDCTETEGGSQELKKEGDLKKIDESDSSDDIEGLAQELKNFIKKLEKELDIEKRFLDKIANSNSSNILEQPASTDSQGVSTNTGGSGTRRGESLILLSLQSTHNSMS